MSLATLPPTQVPTLTEVVDWPPLLGLEAELPATLADAPPTDAAADNAVEDDDVELCIEAPQEPAAATLAEPVQEAASAPALAAAEAPASEPPPPIDETALTQRVLADLQQQVDVLLDQQLRITMQPLLNRLADTLAQQARDELASALRDMVALAVSREMMRLRAEPLRNDPG